MGAHALSVGRVPPVLHIPLEELALGATDQLLAGEPRCRMDQRHGVLQLIAETVGTAGLLNRWMKCCASAALRAAPNTNTISRSCPSASSIWVWIAAHGSKPAPV